jgi:3-deoxy-D-manno-octulosonic-acid transferase
MKYLYTIFIYGYIIIIRIATLFNTKAEQLIKGHKNWKKILVANVEKDAQYIWFHCASLGEFEQGRPLIEAVREKYKQYKIVLTFFSPSGYEMRKNYNRADIIMYLPFDTPRNAMFFLDTIRPVKAFFIKYEYWYFYLSGLNHQKIPLYLISAIFRPGDISFRKGLIREWYKRILMKFDHIFVQDQKSSELLQSIGIASYTISGDTRFDRVAEIASRSRNIPVIEQFKGNSPLIVAGSTWKPDEELLTRFVNKCGDVKMIFAPHEVNSNNIDRLIQMIKKPVIRLSRTDGINIADYKVLIIDSIGILSSVYKYGTIAYVGGGFGVGIHNILEPAVFGMPVIFGPNHAKFKEAVDLIKYSGAFSVANYKQLDDLLVELLKNKDKLSGSSIICKNYVINNLGATTIIIKKVFNN